MEHHHAHSGQNRHIRNVENSGAKRSPADLHEIGDRSQIQQGNALVIFREQPGLESILRVDLVHLRWCWYFESFLLHKLLPAISGSIEALASIEPDCSPGLRPALVAAGSVFVTT